MKLLRAILVISAFVVNNAQFLGGNVIDLRGLRGTTDSGTCETDGRKGFKVEENSCKFEGARIGETFEGSTTRRAGITIVSREKVCCTCNLGGVDKPCVDENSKTGICTKSADCTNSQGASSSCDEGLVCCHNPCPTEGSGESCQDKTGTLFGSCSCSCGKGVVELKTAVCPNGLKCCSNRAVNGENRPCFNADSKAGKCLKSKDCNDAGASQGTCINKLVCCHDSCPNPEVGNSCKEGKLFGVCSCQCGKGTKSIDNTDCSSGLKCCSNIGVNGKGQPCATKKKVGLCKDADDCSSVKNPKQGSCNKRLVCCPQ